MTNKTHIDLTEKYHTDVRLFRDMDKRLNYTAVWLTTAIMDDIHPPADRRHTMSCNIFHIIRNGLRKELLNIAPTPPEPAPTAKEDAAYAKGVKDATDLRKARRRWYNPAAWVIS